jgi:hypothetical protein
MRPGDSPDPARPAAQPAAASQSAEAADDEVPLRAVIRRLLTPARAGLFLSRTDLAHLGAALGFPLPALDRRLMLEHLFLAAGPAGSLPRLLDLLAAEAEAWICTYEQWERAYPRTAAIWADWRGRAQALHADLADMRATTASLVDNPPVQPEQPQ